MTGRALLAVVVLGASAARAADLGPSPEERFDAGYEAYEAGRWEEASREFRAAIESGARDPRLEFNLGNSEFRRGRIGPAILHWERALRLDPGDSDAAANLELARERLVDRIEAPDPGPVVRAMRRAQDSVGPDAQAVALLLLSWAGAAILGWCFRKPGAFGPGWGWALAAVAILLAAVGWSFSATVGRAERGNDAIVMAPAVEVLAGPSEANATVFRIHEGTRVEIREDREGWRRLMLPNGLTGWVPRDAVEAI